MGEGVNKLLICLASARASVVEEETSLPVVRHPEALVWFAEEGLGGDAVVDLDIRRKRVERAPHHGRGAASLPSSRLDTPVVKLPRTDRVNAR
jgi:hypothetical protein